MAVQENAKAEWRRVPGSEISSLGVASAGSGTCGIRKRPVGTETRAGYYVLTEINSERCTRQIWVAEATIIVVRGRLSGMALAARNFAVDHRRPCIVVQLGIGENRQQSVSRVANWIKANRFTCVLVAVSRDLWSNAPRPGSPRSCEKARQFLVKVSEALARTIRFEEAKRLFFVPRRSGRRGKVYRHGDLLIRQIELLPQDARKVDNRVLAQGEHTGHLHELHPIDGSLLDVYESSLGWKYFVTEHALLSHQEHESIVIGVGTYIVEYEQEFDYSFTAPVNAED